MRARTRRLKSLLVGIVSVLWSRHGSHAPQQRRPAATQRLPRCRSGSPPPFASRGPLLGKGRRGWAWITARAPSMHHPSAGCKARAGPLYSRLGAAATRFAPQNGAVASAHRAVPATETPCVQASCRSAPPAALPARLLPVCDTVPMAIAPGAPPIVLIASVEEHPLVGALERRRYAVVQVQTGALAVEWARNFQPDAILLAADLPDMTGIDASRLLHADLRIGHNVPILIIASDRPTPEQRVAALRAGAWDFVRHPGDPEEVALKLQTYVQAKRNIDVAFAEGLIDPATGLHSRPGLARRARELGALMARTHGGLACVVFMLESDAHDMRAAGLLLHTARASDVVGSLGPGEFAALAPCTTRWEAAPCSRAVRRSRSATTPSLTSPIHPWIPWSCSPAPAPRFDTATRSPATHGCAVSTEA